MKNVNILAKAAIVLAVIVVVVLCVVYAYPNEAQNEIALLQCSTMTAVKEYVQRNEMSYHAHDDSLVVEKVPIFGDEATVNFTFDDEVVSQIRVEYILFQYEPEAASEDDVGTTEASVFEFSTGDKTNIDKTFENLKTEFEQYIGGTMYQYDLVPIQEGVTADSEDSFYQGLFLKEYSVRDRNNVLWIWRFQASHGRATARLNKIVDESNYENFIPAMDLTKVQE